MQNLRARWYDPSIGRFISEDTREDRINHPDSQNPYIYVVNNPLIYVDPSGNWCEATVNGKFYSHSGNCSNDGNKIPDYQHHARQAVRDFGDYMPGVSQVINGYESLSGKNIDGEKLSKEERTESAASIALGGAGKAASKVMKFAAKGTDDVTRVRHYTNRKGSKGIENNGVIRAQDNNRVYVEAANKKPLNQVKAETNYQLKPGRGRDFIEFDVPTNSLEWISNPRYGTPELTIKGDLPITNGVFTRRK